MYTSASCPKVSLSCIKSLLNYEPSRYFTQGIITNCPPLHPVLSRFLCFSAMFSDVMELFLVMITVMMPTMTIVMMMMMMTQLSGLLIKRVPATLRTPPAAALLTISITDRDSLTFNPTLPLMGTTLHLLLTMAVGAITVCMWFIFFKAIQVPCFTWFSF